MPGRENETLETLKDKYALLKDHIENKGVARAHIESFNHFIDIEMNKIRNTYKTIRTDKDPNFYMEYVKLEVGEPSINEGYGIIKKITPSECRLRDITYAAPIIATIHYTRNQDKIEKKVQIGRLPIMLHSNKCVLSGKSFIELKDEYKECPLDPGGYFIINGTERVIMLHEQKAKNRMIIEKDSKTGNIICQVTSSTEKFKSRTSLVIKKDGIYLSANCFSDPIPLFIAIKAMGITTIKVIVEMIGTNDDFFPNIITCINDCNGLKIFSQNQAIAYMSEKMALRRSLSSTASPLDEIKRVLKDIILPHVTMDKDKLYLKGFYLAMMARRMLLARDDSRWLDNLDYYGNKRIEASGSLISLLFEAAFKLYNINLKQRIDLNITRRKGAVFDVASHMNQDQISKDLNYAISTGNWKLSIFKMDRIGVSQILTRLSKISHLGMMTRINSQFEKTVKVAGPRSLQPSQFGKICPSDTPEGEACGLVKNLALMAEITLDTDEQHALECMKNSALEELNIRSWDPKDCTVFLNGRIVGITSNPELLSNFIRLSRRKGELHPYVSVHYHENHNCIYVSSDGGRLVRPMVIIEDGKPLLTQYHIESIKNKWMTFKDLVDQGIIEYLDTNEENNLKFASRERDIKNKSYTHMEIDPMVLLGVVAGLIPYSHHNQSPRNTYQCAMGKQAMGTIGLNNRDRMDSLQYSLVYPQKPLVTTDVIEMINFDKLGAGYNAFICVMSYSGFDIEDALILNKASVEKGFGQCIVQHTHKTTIKNHGPQKMDRIMGPKINIETTEAVYSHKALGIDGVANPGGMITDKQVLVNKEAACNVPMTSDSPQAPVKYEPSPLIYRCPNPAYVEKVMITSSADDSHLIKVLERQVREPELGDKFSGRHGQKGVVGAIVPQEEMPYNSQGMTPDLIMNPHGFPSRMTVGKLIELISGKAAALTTKLHYGTAFAGTSVDTIQKELIEYGYNYEGKDIFYNGIDGSMYEGYIYSGIVYYQKLKHMVADKIHARALGPTVALTRQPTEGRSRNGGLRLGEMERDCLISYGASMLIQERLMLSSDAIKVDVCITCGVIVSQNACRLCGSPDHKAVITMPYAFKLLTQELMSMAIAPKFILASVTSNKLVVNDV